MRVVTVGAGLGGLLTSAFLAKAGHEVTVLDKSYFIGGRFTNLNYKGFGLSTGALHMVPHGENGPLAYLLRLLNADVKIVNSDREILHWGKALSLQGGMETS